MTESFLTPRGRKYARIIFLVHRYCSTIRNKFLRKLASQFILGIMASFVYVTILKEGAAEHARRKTEMSRMPSGAGVSKQRNAGEVREMRVSDKGISTFSPLVQASTERHNTSTGTEEEI
jgi:hypothetical protein